MIIHFWDLPEKRTYVTLSKNFKNKLLCILENNKIYLWKFKDRIKNRKISIKKLKYISKNENISLEEIERNVIWIGGINSKGISNPRLPFNFSNRSGARFISAITNDGCLSNTNKDNCYGRLMYDNFDETIRNSVIIDYIEIFGGKPEEIAFRNYEKKKFLEFPSVVRDIVELILKEKGSKCESNLKIPDFIFDSNENMLGWIEQTIADEGEVKYDLKKYRRAIVWRRSVDVTDIFNKKIANDISIRQLPPSLQKAVQDKKCNLIEAEKEILYLLGINYNLYNLGVYSTVKNKIRTRWQISITKRENLLKLRGLITIPSKNKDKKFSESFGKYKRYKEP
ncbi:MAG: hypothetical protein AABX29_06315, partial [Nanoarchaeota archaeon]